MNAMFSYMSDFDRTIAITEAVVENKIMHLELEFQKLMMEHEENKLMIEEKIITESGTSDDLFELYAFEAEEVKEKGKGIIGSIFGAVAKFFRKIKEFLFGTKENIKEDKLPEKVEVPEDPKKLQQEANNVIGGIKSFFSGNKGKLAAIVGAAAATAGTVVLGKKAIKPTIDNLIEYSETIDKELADIDEKIQNSETSPEDMTLLKKAATKLQNIGKRINGVVKAIPKMGTEDYKEIKNKNAEAREQAKEDAKNKKEADKNAKQDELDDKAIADSVKTQEKSSKKIEELAKEKEEVDKKIKELNDRLTELKKNNGAEKTGKVIKDHFANAKAKKDQKRLEELESIPKKKRTEDEQEEYLALATKYKPGNASRGAEITKIESDLEKLSKKKEQIAKSIEGRSKESMDAREKGLNSTVSKAGRGSVNESVDGLSDIDELLDLL